MMAASTIKSRKVLSAVSITTPSSLLRYFSLSSYWRPGGGSVHLLRDHSTSSAAVGRSIHVNGVLLEIGIYVYGPSDAP